MSSFTIASSGTSSLHVDISSTHPNTLIEIDSQTFPERPNKLKDTFTKEVLKNCDKIEEKHNDVNSHVLRTSPVAWVLLIFVVLLRAAGNMFGNTYNPIPSVIAEFMGVSLTSINWLFNVMMLVHLFSSFFTSWLFQSIGVKRSLVLSGVILSLGCWIRWISAKLNPPSYPVLVLGHVIGSFSPPIIMNMTTTFSSLWFTENRRATATSAILPCPGILIAVVVIPKIVTNSDRVELAFMLLACFATACTIPLIFFPSKPRTPTSYASPEKTDDVPQPSLLKGALLLMKNPQFLILVVVMGINHGINNAWDALINQAITPYGYSDNQAGIIAAVGILGQTVGYFVCGPILDKSKQHKILLKLMTPLMVSTYVAHIFLTKADSYAALIYINFLYQFFFSFVTPICIDMGVEVSYPLPESLSTSILWQSAQFFGIVFVAVMDQLRDSSGIPKNNMHKALVFQAALGGVCLVFALAFNGPMKRIQALKEQEDAIVNLSSK